MTGQDGVKNGQQQWNRPPWLKSALHPVTLATCIIIIISITILTYLSTQLNQTGFIWHLYSLLAATVIVVNVILIMGLLRSAAAGTTPIGVLDIHDQVIEDKNQLITSG